MLNFVKVDPRAGARPWRRHTVRAWVAVLVCLIAVTATVAAESTDGQLAGPVRWNLAELEKAPHYEDAPVNEPGLRGVFYDGLPVAGKPTRVFAWIGLPKRLDAKVPGMVLVHGGGGTAHARWVRLWNERGYAAIAMDTCGAGLAADEPNQKRLDDGGPPGWDASFTQVDLPVEDQWPYQAVADVVLAHSLLRSLPEVDAERIGLTGISWGGFLTCITAGVDQRFKFAAPVYGCGFLGEESAWTPKLTKMGAKGDKWLALWDPSVYLPNAKMPMLWVSGDLDFAYPLGPLQKSYRLPPGDRYLAIRHAMPHGHPSGEGPPEILALASQLFSQGVPLARATAQGIDGQKAWAQFAAQEPLLKAQVVSTKDVGPWTKRQWSVAEAELDKTVARVTATLPEGTRAFYFNLFDARDCVASSEHVEVEP
jgi:dienelactone hydrolase